MTADELLNGGSDGCRCETCSKREAEYRPLTGVAFAIADAIDRERTDPFGSRPSVGVTPPSEAEPIPAQVPEPEPAAVKQRRTFQRPRSLSPITAADLDRLGNKPEGWHPILDPLRGWCERGLRAAERALRVVRDRLPARWGRKSRLGIVTVTIEPDISHFTETMAHRTDRARSADD